MGLLEKSKRLAKNIKSARRLREIILVLARHGFQDILRQAGIGRQILDRLSFKWLAQNKDLAEFSVPQRIRMSFEQLGPTFVKLGQMLSTRPDLIPPDLAEELKKLQSQVQPVSFEDLEDSLIVHFGKLNDTFSFFDKKPFASASMSQVHRATLKEGQKEVVVKIRRPGIVETIANDLNALDTLAVLLERYIPESRVYNPHQMVDEFFKAMELETNFIFEAGNTLRFQKNFQDSPYLKIPQVFVDLSCKHILVMEEIKGIPLNNQQAFKREKINTQLFLKNSVKMFVKMVFSDSFFHGDLHAGNIFVLPDNKIGLVDFGMVGRLSKPLKQAIASMCIALINEDYDRLAYQFVDLAPYNEKIHITQFARQLRDLIAPYFGLSGLHINSGHLLMSATGLAAKHHIKVPVELVMFFKSIVTIDGMGRRISKDFDLIQEITEASEEIIKSKYNNIDAQFTEIRYFLQDTIGFLVEAPGQTRQWIKKIGSPTYKFPVEINEIKHLRRTIDNSSKLFFLGLIISGMIIASSLALSFNTPSSQSFLGLPLVSGIGFAMALFLSLLAFYNYIKK